MNKLRRLMLLYVGLALFFFIFGQIYLSFVPGVTNLFMRFAFIWYTLLLGIHWIPHFQKKIKDRPNAATWLSLGVLTLSLTSIMQGVLDIALANHPLLFYFWMIGVLQTIISLIFVLKN